MQFSWGLPASAIMEDRKIEAENCFGRVGLRRAATIKAGSVRFSNRCGAAGRGFGNVWNLSPKIKRVASGSRTDAAQPEEDFVVVLKLSPKISTLSGPLEFFFQSAREDSLHRFLAADLIPRKLVTWFSDVS
jgi:hypothetical protein